MKKPKKGKRRPCGDLRPHCTPMSPTPVERRNLTTAAALEYWAAYDARLAEGWASCA